MAQTIDTEPNISKRAHEMYERTLRAQVEHGDNIGKMLVLDVDTGEYDIDLDGIAANARLRQRLPRLNPQSLYAFRIGYDAVYSFGGAGIHRTSSLDEDNVKGSFTQQHEWTGVFHQERGKPNMTTTLAEVQRAANSLPIGEQLELAAYICEHVRHVVPAPAATPRPKFSMEEYLAQCDALAEQIEGEFDSVDDIRKIREERSAGIE